MNFFKRTYLRLKKEVKFSVINPKSFKEIWSVNSTGVRLISLTVIFLILFSVLISLLLRVDTVRSYLDSDNKSINRELLEEQEEHILNLSQQIESQASYIENIKLILLGELPVNTPLDSISAHTDSLARLKFDSKMTEKEEEIAREVKDDMSTFSQDDESKSIIYFAQPAKGVVSQSFNKKSHTGIDVVTTENSVVKACLSGVVIYSGYTHKDGHILIIEHIEGVISVYKHNQRVMKKAGSKVQIGDPIAIVGNTGENTDGPHLHFELWIDQQAVDPEDYLNFTH
tara:strand:+ start:53962 stop:54816 length:855 start_codon:yes stop_codon:yes gene_type:complete